MKLSVAANWDPGLIEALSPFPVYEVFGALASTPVGGGRPSFLLAQTTKEEATDYIQAVHRKGWSFNYVMNAPCMGNMEYDKETHRAIIQHLEWLCDIGIDTITVSIPYLLQIIKRQFPELEVKISVIAHVNSIARLRFYESLGADEITIDYMSNRDFEFLRRAKEAADCDLTLLVNDMCLYQCPYRTYHYNICGHASQGWHPTEGFYIDYCIVNCTMQKINEPEQLIRSRWIRPEDLGCYEALGYQKFKISGRRMSTAWLARAAAAYTQHQYEGNLADLLNGVTPGVDPDAGSPQYETMMSGAESLNAENLVTFGQFFAVKPFIDNRTLDGFLDYFEEQNCVAGCADCTYCETVAKRTVHLDEQETRRYLGVLKELADDLISSRIFFEEHDDGESKVDKGDKPTQMGETIEWNAEIRKEFDQITSSIPAISRPMARRVIAKKSEEIAQVRGSQTVQREDMVRAFLQYTPKAFKANMLNGLKAVGIDPGEY